jgi:hypothetical protein
MKSKDTKRAEAIARQKEYDSLSPDDKLKRALSSPGDSKRELARLFANKTEAA